MLSYDTTSKHFFFALLLVCSNALGWGLKGHILIGEMAFHYLPPQKQHLAAEYAAFILKHSKPKNKRRLRYYSSANRFAKVAALPDAWRSTPLKKIFHRFRATLPNAFSPYAQDPIDQWHFIDHAYPHTYCHTVKAQNVVWAIRQIKKIWPHTKNPNTKALLMVLLEHFIGDIHQPLHNLNHINSLCLDSDLGGNRYSVTLQTPYEQHISLHHLWDEGVGYLTQPINFQQRATQLEKQYPRTNFSKQLSLKNPYAWSMESVNKAPFVYSIPRGETPSNAYHSKAQRIVKKQLALAAYRLANTLNELLR